MAESIVRDFMDSQYMAGDDARPALWCMPGEWASIEIVTDKVQQERLEA